MYVLRYIVNQGTKQSESQHLLHSKRPRHVTNFCSHFSAETVAFQCGTQWSKFREGYVPKAGGCVPKWDAVSMLKYALESCGTGTKNGIPLNRPSPSGAGTSSRLGGGAEPY